MNEVEFWRSVERQTSCWVWKGGQSAGFGICNFNGKTELVHRVSWFLKKGTFPKKIHNTCGTNLCVNPEHWVRFDSYEYNQLRFLKHVQKTSTCWLWTGSLNKTGYGKTTLTLNGKTVSHNAHRAAYRLFIGEPPINTEIDHLCHGQANCQEGRKCIHRRCVNPAHLEAVTRGTNWSRSNNNSKKTHCPQGHEYSSSNTTLSKGRRRCKTCSRRRK